MLAETTRAMNHLSDYCRKGEGDLPAGVDPERASVYRTLIFSSLTEVLERAFPISHSLLEGDPWDHLVKTFVAEEVISTPYLWQMPREFRDFVKNRRYQEQWDLPFLDDLCHFEWLEIAVQMMPDGKLPPFLEGGHVMRDRMVLNPDHSLDHLQYPVFSGMAADWLEKRGTYFLLTYRTRPDFTVRYSSLSSLGAIVVELLRQQPLSGAEIAEWLVEEQGQEPKAMDEFCRNFLEELVLQEVVAGFVTE